MVWLSASMGVFVFHLITLLFFLHIIEGGSFMVELRFFDVSSIDLSFMLVLDWISVCFASIVLLITGMVMIYSYFYMWGDLSISRYYWLLILFVLSMLLLVFSPNLFSLMVGWDGLGLVSFCLVIYYNGPSSLRSGLITVYTNRLGDVAVVLGISFMLKTGFWGSWGVLGLKDDFIVGSLVFFAAITKSAQIPFSSWLPAAMAAPTPISSLVHSSTLVTAGVYLLIRFYFSISSFLMSWLSSLLSSFTMFLAGMIAFFETDMKKVVAMSTLSQLGLMIYMISLGEWVFSYFHMVCHAIFKSLLFLGCGVFISASAGGQDMRMKNGLSYFSPLAFSSLVISSLSLVGFPFMAGFYSKDSCLDIIYLGGGGSLSYFFFLGGCVLTLVYSVRLILSSTNWSGVGATTAFSTSSKLLSCSLPTLNIWSIFVGCLVGCLLVSEESVLLSGVVKSFGLMIVVLGALVFVFAGMFQMLFLMGRFFSDMAYVNWASGPASSSLAESIGFYSFGDLTWGEFFGAKGSFSALVILSHTVWCAMENYVKTLVYYFFIIIFLFVVML